MAARDVQTVDSVRRPRVVHIVSGDQWAGAEVMAAGLIGQIHKNRHRCEVNAVCLNEGVLADRLRDHGVNVLVMPERTLGFVSILARVARYFAGVRIEILHSHRYKEHALAASLSPLTSSRLVATVHGMPEPARAIRRRYQLQSWATARLLKYRFDRVVAVSQALGDDLTRSRLVRSSQLKVILNGISPPPGINTRRGETHGLHIGSVGRLVPVKRFDLFLETAKLIVARFPTARFSILGDGPDKPLLLAQAASLGLQSVFTIVDSTTNPWPFLASLDLYLNTSEHEGLPMSVLEAMAAGAPVVASAVGGIPEVIGHGTDGLLVSSSRAEDYASACVSLLTDQALRFSVIGNARQLVETEYSTIHMANEYVTLYEQLLSERGPAQ